MNTWYILSIGALICFGCERFLYKVSAARNLNTAWTTFAFMATVTGISAGLFFMLGAHVAGIPFLVLVSLVNSVSFFVSTVSQIEALKHVHTSIVYPLIRLNTVIVVVFSLFYFKDSLSFSQGLGIILSIAVMVFMTRQLYEQKGSIGNRKVGLMLVMIAMVAGAVAAISSKFAALHTNILAFIALSYTMGMMFSFSTRKRFHIDENNPNIKQALLLGFFIGLVNLAGFYLFLRALAAGPLSIIISITSMHFVVAIALTALIYREKITLPRLTGICLSVASIILMRL